MSSKKSLLTESEIRRFMTLANIPALGKPIKESALEMEGSHEEKHEAYAHEGAMAEEEAGEEEMDMGELEGGEGEEAGAGGKEELVSQIIDLLDQLAPGVIEKEMGGEEAGEEMAAGEEEAGEEAGEEEEEDSP